MCAEVHGNKNISIFFSGIALPRTLRRMIPCTNESSLFVIHNVKNEVIQQICIVMDM